MAEERRGFGYYFGEPGTNPEATSFVPYQRFVTPEQNGMSVPIGDKYSNYDSIRKNNFDTEQKARINGIKAMNLNQQPTLMNDASSLMSSRMKSGIVGGIFGLAGDVVGGLATAYSARKNLEGMKMMSNATNNQTDLQRDIFNKEWDSAKAVGLANPAQFGTISGMQGSMSSRSISFVPRTRGPSVFTLN